MIRHNWPAGLQQWEDTTPNFQPCLHIEILTEDEGFDVYADVGLGFPSSWIWSRFAGLSNAGVLNASCNFILRDLELPIQIHYSRLLMLGTICPFEMLRKQLSSAAVSHPEEINAQVQWRQDVNAFAPKNLRMYDRAALRKANRSISKSFIIAIQDTLPAPDFV